MTESVELVPTDVSSPPPLPVDPKTYAFWLTVATSLVSLLAGFGLIGPNWAHLHEGVVQALAFLAAAVNVGLYALARAIAQHGHQQAVARVIAPPVAPAAPVVNVSVPQPAQPAPVMVYGHQPPGSNYGVVNPPPAVGTPLGDTPSS